MGIDKFQPPTKSVPLNQSKKIRHSWLRPQGDPLYQIWYKSTHWGLLGKWVKYNKTYFYLFIPFSETWVQVRPVDGVLRAMAQKTWNHARMCLFGVIKLKFNIKPLFIPKKRSNFGQNWTSYFFAWKCLTMGALKSKLPLIIIVAP